MRDRQEELATFTLQRDGAPPLRFKGELLAETRSSPDRGRGDWSGATGRWTELRLYRTKGGKFVCQRINRTQWQGERDSFEAVVCQTENDVMEFFGWGWLAKDLYAEAGLDAAEDVA